jgi:hypothetical protein
MHRQLTPLRRPLLLICATLAVALACSAEFTLVEIDHAETLPIPAELAGQPLQGEELAAGEGLDPLDSPEMEQYGGTAAAVGEAYVVEASLTAIGGAGNLDFLEEIAFFVTAPGLDRRLLAEQMDIPAGKSWVALDVNEELDLTDYVTEGVILPVVVVTGVGPDDETALQIDFTMSLGVSVAGACEAVFGEAS